MHIQQVWIKTQTAAEERYYKIELVGHMHYGDWKSIVELKINLKGDALFIRWFVHQEALDSSA